MRALLLVIVMWALTTPALGKKIALVVANQAYPGDEELTGMQRDAKDLAKTLREMGFAVTERFDVNAADLTNAFAEHARRLKPDDISFVYVGAHGSQEKGEPMLWGTDNKPAAVNELIDSIHNEKTNPLFTVVALHACRQAVLTKNARAKEFGGTNQLIRKDVIVVYSTGVGQLSWDPGAHENSTFVRALLSWLPRGLEVNEIFKGVESMTRGSDEHAIVSSGVTMPRYLSTGYHARWDMPVEYLQCGSLFGYGRCPPMFVPPRHSPWVHDSTSRCGMKPDKISRDGKSWTTSGTSQCPPHAW